MRGLEQARQNWGQERKKTASEGETGEGGIAWRAGGEGIGVFLCYMSVLLPFEQKVMGLVPRMGNTPFPPPCSHISPLRTLGEASVSWPSCNSVRSPSHWWSRGNPVSHLGAAWRLLPWAALYISSLLTLCLDDFCHKKLQNFVGKKKSKIKSKTKFTKNRGNRKSRASLRMALSDWKGYHVSTLSETIELLF